MTNLSFLIFKDTELFTCLAAGLFLAIVLILLFHFLPYRSRREQKPHVSSLPFVRSSTSVHPFKKADLFACVLITLLFAFCSLWKLGSTVFPTTTWQPSEESQTVVLRLPEDTEFTSIYTIYGEGDNNALESGYQLSTENIEIAGSNDGVNYEQMIILEKGRIYEYSITSGDWDYRYIRITAGSAQNTLTEIGFYNETEDTFLPVIVEKDSYADSAYPASLMIDEQDKLVSDPTYYDEAYFDEIYHIRNAWEIANGEDMYATVHPLLGTNIIALFIKLFGLCPFVWRLPGALFSIAMVPLMFATAHLLFGSTMISSAAAVLLAGDFMHMTTGRIGTLEPFSVFLILLMFYWMLRYARTSFYDTPFRTQMKYLLLCGISMGLACSAKWTGCYSAVGLAIVLFTNLIQRYLEYRKAQNLLQSRQYENEEQKEEAEHIVHVFGPCTLRTILLCFVFFIFLPVLIYAFCYLPDRVWKGDTWSFLNVWKQCVSMYNYHTTLTATHPYQSQWWQWILDLRPIWYYYGSDSSGFVHTIACFSNPLLCWAGLPAVGYTLYSAIRRKDNTAWFIFIGYLTALGPWISFVQRCVFSYHFYPASIFTILSIAYTCAKIQKRKYGKELITGFLLIYVLNFLMFLPTTAGYGTSQANVKALEWLESWYFG